MDTIDKKILEALQKNSSQPLSELSKKIGLSSTPCWDRIKKLEDNIIAKIAAGEIIENPSSVIKELMDNCIDALATNIEIEFHNGGKDYIRISDNGTGIIYEDLKIAEYKIKDLLLGQEFSFTKKISSSDVDMFAKLTGDNSPIHMESGFARERGFKDRVVHGGLLVGCISHLIRSIQV